MFRSSSYIYYSSEIDGLELEMGDVLFHRVEYLAFGRRGLATDFQK